VATIPFVLNVEGSGISVAVARLAGGPEIHSVEERCLRVGEVGGVAGDDDVVDERRRGMKLVRHDGVSGRRVEDCRHAAGRARDEQQVAPRIVLHPGGRHTVRLHQGGEFACLHVRTLPRTSQGAGSLRFDQPTAGRASMPGDRREAFRR
jgi:hypothetical protein